jgi:hypothetical protein
MIVSRRIFLRIGIVSDKSKENQNSYFIFRKFVSENLSVYAIVWKNTVEMSRRQVTIRVYKDADKSLARPGRKEAIATEDFDIHISYL